jgi:hypothetical protein
MSGKRLARPTAAWCIGVAAALMVATAWGAFLYSTNFQTVYWNLGSNSHLYSYLHPILYVVAALAAVHAVSLGVRSMRSPGQRPGLLLVSGLVFLLALAVWACIATLLGRAYSV